MALSNSRSCLLRTQQIHPILLKIFVFFVLPLPFSNSISFNFNFDNSRTNDGDIRREGDAFFNNEGLQLTKNQADDSLGDSAGRASYAEPVCLWDANTSRLTDFTTHFSFIIKTYAVDDKSYGGDGLSFFLAPFNSSIPDNSSGAYLALFSGQSAFNTTLNQIVAVEFDTFQNTWDPSPYDSFSDHVGIDVNSIKSVATVSWPTSMKNGTTANARITYNSSTQNLSVFLTYAKNPDFNGNPSLSYIVDFRKVLPEWVTVGFSAATGQGVESHNVLSWTFSSTLEVKENREPTRKKENPVPTPKKNKNRVGFVVGLIVATGVLCFLMGLLWFILWRKRAGRNKEDTALDVSTDDEFEKGTGPKRFTYGELSRATNNFAEEGKLGQGGFGGVYKGLLSGSNIEVAVKRFSRGSTQGKKEYKSEVKIISRLRHRNLVQLIGWCHEQSEFLLVYELMLNGSLDSHLFRGKITLTWTVRYKIALGLASALLYLHEEWEQCVVHRDIKSSNIMLDSNFNAKLGDFGLARLVDHDLGLQTTVLAGTMGYLAPECATTGKASKESDVYSFGVVALEITCGRRPVEAKAEPSKVSLVEWVWGLYGQGQLLEAVDQGLLMEFDERQIECLMVVGLSCCHPDPTVRPSIRQVINVLNFEAPLPKLPSKLPVPVYFAPPMNMKFSYTSSGLIDSEKDQTGSSYSTSTANSTMSASSSRARLQVGN